MKSIAHGATSVALEHVRTQYTDLLSSGSFSLQQLFNPDQFRLQDYCKQFSPHPRSEELKDIAQAFGEKYGIWLPNAKHYITCTLFLYPTASFERMEAIVKNNAVDYYLNDVMGRDVFRFLSPEQQQEARQIIQRMAGVNENLWLPHNVQPIENANAAVLRDIRSTSPAGWFSKFLRYYSYHIEVTHKDLNAETIGYIPTVRGYIDLRNHTSGMPHIVMLAEYCNGAFLDWQWLESIQLAEKLKQLHHVTALFGCLSNDLFSFEKEVIDNETDSNLVMVVALNNSGLTLREVIFKSAMIVKQQLSDYFRLLEEIKALRDHLYQQNESKANDLFIHLDNLERGMQACWMWQVETIRFKRKNSIWKETTLTMDRSVVAG